jgi:hypothetical protein
MKLIRSFRCCSSLALLNVHLYPTQVILGFVRPTPNAELRPKWNLVHHNLGRVTLCAAWTTIYLGIYLAHTSPSYLFTYSQWLAPVVVVMGFMVFLDIALSLIRCYMPRADKSSDDKNAPPEMTELSNPLADPAMGRIGSADPRPVESLRYQAGHQESS